MARPSTLEFLRTESGAGAFLLAAAMAAMVAANSSAADAYFGFINAEAPVRLGYFDQTRTVLSWTRDGLMAVFFLVVGMEIKFEFLRGEFSSPRRLALPIVAALGGMIGPALTYLAVSAAMGGSSRGWPVPTPTDVAFSLAALSLVGRGLPESLRLFLMTLAVADDLGAVVLIGTLYSTPIHPLALGGAGLTLAMLAGLSRWKAAPRLFYIVGFVVVWAFTLQSGVNTAVAGLACAATVPIGARRADQESVLKLAMDSLHPFVAYGVLPFFAFVSAGFSLRDLGWGGLFSPVAVAVAVGLLVGKPLGVAGASSVAVALRLGRRPLGVTWLEMFGVSLLCGAGFTMSFFIGALAFAPGDAHLQGQLRAAVIIGSALSVLCGGAVLSAARGLRAGGSAGEG